MSNKKSFTKKLGEEVGDVVTAVRHGLRRSGVALRNRIRQARGLKVDYLVMPIGGPLPERSGPPRSFIQRQLPLPSQPLTMQMLNARLRAVADAGNVKGIIFIFQGFSANLATLQNFRRSLQRLREAGKEVIVYTPYLDAPHYFAATAADKIIVPPSAHFEVLGLRSEALFLKDALAQIGVEVDIVQISPYKSAGNMFSKSDITPEQQEQMAWLLDESFDILTAGMGEGRGKSQQAIRELIDQAPLRAEEALAHGLVDHLAYEDEVAFLLAASPTAVPPTAVETSEAKKPNSDHNKRPRAKLTTWKRGYSMLMEKSRRPLKKYIGVVTLEGMITMGASRQPPPVDIPIPFVGGPTAGEQTIIQLLRRAERDDRMGALIFHVDSRGGSALASDLIWRQIQRIRQKKPVLVYMGNVAASGGYYVSAAANHIMTQSGTITGSIGVISGRPSTGGLYEKIHVNRVSLTRGERANLYSDEKPLTPEEREILWASIVDTYEQFKQVVADGRGLPLETLDPVCEGRVWSGRQALAHKLVDSHGDFVDAIFQAAELADLPATDLYNIATVNFHPKEDYVLPRPFAPAEEWSRLLSGRWLTDLLHGPLVITPFSIKFW